MADRKQGGRQPKRLVCNQKPLLLTCTKGADCACCDYMTECSFCRHRGKRMAKCAACKVVRYCSEKCLTADWATHGPLCGVDGPITAFDFSFDDYLAGVAAAYAPETELAEAHVLTACSGCRWPIPPTHAVVSCRQCGARPFCCRACFTNAWPVHCHSCTGKVALSRSSSTTPPLTGQASVPSASAKRSLPDCRAVVLPGHCQVTCPVEYSLTAAVKNCVSEVARSSSETNDRREPLAPAPAAVDSLDESGVWLAVRQSVTAYTSNAPTNSGNVVASELAVSSTDQGFDSLDQSDLLSAVRQVEAAYSAQRRSDGLQTPHEPPESTELHKLPINYTEFHPARSTVDNQPCASTPLPKRRKRTTD